LPAGGSDVAIKVSDTVSDLMPYMLFSEYSPIIVQVSDTFGYEELYVKIEMFKERLPSIYGLTPDEPKT
jgi:hypothetical protein